MNDALIGEVKSTTKAGWQMRYCECLFRCFESGVRCTVFAELFSAPHSPQ